MYRPPTLSSPLQRMGGQKVTVRDREGRSVVQKKGGCEASIIYRQVIVEGREAVRKWWWKRGILDDRGGGGTSAEG